MELRATIFLAFLTLPPVPHPRLWLEMLFLLLLLLLLLSRSRTQQSREMLSRRHGTAEEAHAVGLASLYFVSGQPFGSLHWINWRRCVNV